MTRWLLAASMAFLLTPVFPVAHADFNSTLQGVQGAQSTIHGSVHDTAQRAQSVFKSMGIQAIGKSSQNGGTLQILNGKKGNNSVEVKMNQSAQNETHIAVTAKQGSLKWNKSLAQNVLNKIIQSG